jgi:hypothetical protein
VASRAGAWPSAVVARLREDPCAVLTEAGIEVDGWQREALQSAAPRLGLNCSRQSGKSTVVAGLALRTALTVPGSLTAIISPSLRQSAETYRKVADLYRTLGRPVPAANPRDNTLRLELVTGARVLSLPGTENTTRGFTPSLVVVDEASRVPDDVFRSLRPSLGVSRGRLVCASTPMGRRGWWWEEWSGGEGWQRLTVPATACPRLSASFLAEEARALGPRWFRQEYLCSFEEVVGSLFRQEDIDAVADDTVRPLFAPAVTPTRPVPADLADERPPLFAERGT